MMKLKIYIRLFLLVALNSVYAQVGIGTTSPNGALDVLSTNDGLIIPRVALTATNVATIVTPTISELVYNTFTSAVGPNQVTPGFYYWDGGLWNKLAVGNTNNDWTLTGNAGTNVATNFFGTTDDKDIIFKRNNVRAGYIGDPYYDPGTFDYNNGNTAFGANSLLNPTINIATQAGVRNTALGVNVMPGLTTGRLNIGVGDFALFSNLSGLGNLAIGNGALYTNSSANNNVAVGRNALTNSNANNNTAVGFASLRQNASGTNNTSLGYEALRNVLGSGNVGIGYQAGRLETDSNKLYIENSNANADNALIYGEFDNNIVRVNGTLQISNPASAPGYALPNVRGTNGQVLQTDGAGATTWVDATTLTVTETDPQISSATTDFVPKWNGTALVDGIITDDGTNVGIGVVPSAGNKLEVNGKTKTIDFQMTNGATDTYFLKSDASGNGSWAAIPVNTVLPYTTTGIATGIYFIALTEYTVRVFNDVSEVRLPAAAANTGKIFIVIGSNGIGTKTFSSSGGGIYDDVTDTNITVLNANERYTVQSDGGTWIVIGR